MDSNLSDMLKGVLSDPDAMQKLMGAAETLMGNNTLPSRPRGEEEEQKAAFANETEEPQGTKGKTNEASDASVSVRHEKKVGNDERIALLCALRPYLSPERRKTADQLIQMLKMMKVADLTKLFHS